MPSTTFVPIPSARRRTRTRVAGAMLAAAALALPAVAGTESASAFAKQPVQQCVPGTTRNEPYTGNVYICDGSGNWRWLGIRFTQVAAF